MFKKIEEIAVDLKGLVDGTGLFKKVQLSAASDYKQLAENVKNCTALPAAFIVVGNGDFTPQELERKFAIGIVIVTPFKATNDADATTIWQCLETVAARFLPVLGDDAAPDFVEYNNVTYELTGWQMVGLDVKCSSVVLELTATEAAEMEM